MATERGVDVILVHLIEWISSIIYFLFNDLSVLI